MDSTLLSNFNQLSINHGNHDNFTLMDGESSRTSMNDYSVEVENNYPDHTSPFNINFLPFFNEGCGSVDSFRRMLYFDGAGSYAIPNHQQQLVSQNIGHIFEIVECWLIEKLFHNNGVMPILEEPPQSATDEIMSKLREDPFVLKDLSNVLISIRAGHVYSLHMIGDEIVMPRSYESFAKRFPLFVNVSVDVQKLHCPETRHNSHNTCKVFVVAERVIAPSIFSQTKHVTPSAGSGIFFQLEEVVTSVNATGNGGN